MADPLPWNETFSLGHRVLDAQHRGMIDLINQICRGYDADQSVPQLLTLFQELESLTVRHFEYEEAVLEKFSSMMPKVRRILCEMLAASRVGHAAEHGRMLSDLRDMARTLPSRALAVKSKLTDRLKAWFIDHAIGYEAQIKTVLQSI